LCCWSSTSFNAKLPMTRPTTPFDLEKRAKRANPPCQSSTQSSLTDDSLKL
jgi:hypothetical protein